MNEFPINSIDRQSQRYVRMYNRTKINASVPRYNKSMNYLQKHINRLNDEMKWDQFNYLHMYGNQFKQRNALKINARYVLIELHRMFK